MKNDTDFRIHLGFTFHDYDHFSLNAGWFASAGIAMILAGFLNVAVKRGGGKDKVIWVLCLTAIVIFAIRFALVSFIMPQPQVYVGILLLPPPVTLTSLNISRLVVDHFQFIFSEIVSKEKCLSAR